MCPDTQRKNVPLKILSLKYVLITIFFIKKMASSDYMMILNL